MTNARHRKGFLYYAGGIVCFTVAYHGITDGWWPIFIGYFITSGIYDTVTAVRLLEKEN